MKFTVVHVGKAGGRVGAIALEQTSGGSSARVLETPFSLTYTRGGSVPHLIPEVTERLGWASPLVLQAPLASQVTLHPVLDQFGRGYKAFTGLEGLLYSCNHDPMVATPSGYNDKAGISVWPRGGRTQLDAARFVRLQAAVQPDWLELLCDSDTPPDASKKRQRKSLDRSLELLDQCLTLRRDHQTLSDTAVFGPLVGGHVLADRLRSARAAADRPLDGFVLEGLANGPDSLLLPSVDDIAELVRETVAALPEDKPRVLHGAWRPLHVLRLVERGADVFDSTYPCLAADRGAALVFPLVPAAADRTAAGEAGVDSRDSGRPDAARAPAAAYEITLGDERHREDGGPLVEGCTCYTCGRHSRAYIHHLVQVKELLAPLLLTVHNLHHWSAFFAATRSALADGTLADLISVHERLEGGATERNK